MLTKLFQADTISGLEKENLKLVKALNEMETQWKKDKDKRKKVEQTLDEERNSLMEKLNKMVSEFEAEKKNVEEIENVLSHAQSDVIKLTEENAKLKEQVRDKKI